MDAFAAWLDLKQPLHPGLLNCDRQAAAKSDLKTYMYAARAVRFLYTRVSCGLFSISSTMSTLSQAKEFFRRADAVCFDVDSTVIKEEGIDELAKFCGVQDAVTEMCVCIQHFMNMHWKVHCHFDTIPGFLFAHCRTRKAMGGSMPFKKALTERLSTIRCSREQVNKLITDHPPQLTPGIRWVKTACLGNVFDPLES